MVNHEHALRGDHLADHPFPTLAKALEAARTAKGGADGAAFAVITRRGAGFDVFRYPTSQGRARLGDVLPNGLPLGSATGGPQTWVLDGDGALGHLVRTNATPSVEAQLHLDEVNTRFLTEPKKSPGVGLPAVLPTPQMNHSKNVRFTPTMAFRPSANIDELSAVVRFVHDHLPSGTKIKAGGSLHAYSDVAATTAVFVHPEHMKGIAAVAPKGAINDTLRETVGDHRRRHLVEVVAGTTVAELNQDLWNRGLAIPNLGGYDGQTVGGVLGTGTHGSVLGRGPMFEMVQATTLVRADGSQVRIEPKDGISDPDTFKAQHPNITLLQDDDAFAASLLHNGALGIVHSHVLDVVDAFHLKETRTLIDVDTVKTLLKDGGVYNLFASPTDCAASAQRTTSVDAAEASALPGHPARNFHLEFWFNPHSDTAVVTSRNKVDVDVEPRDLHQRPGRDLLEALRMGATWTRPLLPTWLTENAPTLVGGTSAAVARLVPKATPWLIDQGMKILPDEEYVQRSYNVFNIGDGANAIPALAASIFVPLRDDLYLKALDVLRETAAAFADEGKYQTAPLSLRFVKGSQAALGMNEDVASFEIIFAEGTPHASEMTAAYYAALRTALGDAVRYHWGQHSPNLSADDVAASYPGLSTFRSVREEFDPKGVFLNHTQERVFAIAPANPPTMPVPTLITTAP